MFPKSLKINSFFVLLLFCGCVMLVPITTYAGPAQVNLNTATADQLEALPGIGPDLAQRILAYRSANGPFKNVDGLLNVKGIGEGKLSKLRDQITVERSDQSANNNAGSVH